MGGAEREAHTRGGIVGRRDELALLDRELNQALEGHLGLVLVEGEPGIGKTRLVSAFAATAAARGVRIMSGACLELGTAVPYLPFAELLRDLVRGLGEPERAAMLGPDREVLEPLLRAGRSSTPATTRGRLEAAGAGAVDVARLAMFESLLRMTERMAERAPRLVVLEDLQWADRASLDLLTFLVRNLQPARILLVMTARTGWQRESWRAAFVAGLDRHHRVERIELRALDLDEVTSQLEGILGRPPALDVSRLIHEQSGGNPLFAEELLAWTTSGAFRPAAESPRLRDIVSARVAPLPAEARDVLRVASAAGRVVSDELLTAACGLSPATVATGIRAAVAEGLLVRAVGPRDGYRFRHDLVRDAVDAELLPGERARLHEAFAEVLESGRPGMTDPGELAHHWDAAGRPGRALAAHIEAGRAAREVFAFDAAREHFDRALALWPAVRVADDLTSYDWVDLAQAAAFAAAMAGDHARAIELERMVLERLGADGRDPRAVAAREQLRRSLWESGDTAGALREAEEAARIVDPRPSRDRATVLSHLAALLLFSGQVRRARAVAGEALEMSSALGVREEMAVAHGILGWSLLYAGRIDAAIAFVRQAWTAAEELGEPHGRALAHDHLARVLEFAGRTNDGARIAAAGVELCRRHGLERSLGALLAADGARCLVRLGRMDEAGDVLRRALAAGPVGPGHLALLAASATFHVERDELVAADAAVAEATDLARQIADRDWAGWLAVNSASLAIRRGDPAGAMAMLGALVTPSGSPRVGGARAADAGAADESTEAANGSSEAADEGIPFVALGTSIGPLLAVAARAVAESSLRGRARAIDAAEQATVRGEHRRVAGMVAWLGRRAELATALATNLAIATAELSRAESPTAPDTIAAWRRALEAAGGTGGLDPSPVAQAYASLRLAEALVVERSSRGEVGDSLAAGLEFATQSGAAAVEADLRTLASRARIRIRGETERTAEPTTAPVAANPFGLTDRELEVLRLVAAGQTNREIGDRLFMSPKTASVHVSSILGKLGVPGRVEAAVLAQQVGLVTSVDRTQID